MTERVSNEQADLMARCGYDPIIQIGLAPPINASDLAADLLDARVEIERLRADRDCDGNGMTCTHRAALRRCHDLLERAQNLPFIDTNNEWDKWDADVEAELLACDKAGEREANWDAIEAAIISYQNAVLDATMFTTTAAITEAVKLKAEALALAIRALEKSALASVPSATCQYEYSVTTGLKCDLPAVLCECHGGHDACAMELMKALQEVRSIAAEKRAVVNAARSRGEGERAKPDEWTMEGLAEAIAIRQVILRNVDGGTNIGTITPADAAMLARVALSRPLPKPAEAYKVVIHGHYDADSNRVRTIHGEPLVAFETDEGSLAPLDGKQVSVTVRGE